MTSYPAPTQNIDFFNPAFFTVDETPLTVADANKLYFKKSGGIISGAVSMPSLTLNGTNVENKLTEIDVNSSKLTDISFNSNTTSILNNLSVNGILTLPNLPNVGTDVLSNKQKTTKITYDAGTSTTTIGDTLKASSTLIVGSQNYNASDEFNKLQNISRNASTLTINDSIYLSGTFSFPSFGDVENTLTLFEETINNISYDIPTNSTIITDTLKATGTLIVGSQNYNASNEFFKLSDVAKNGNNLTINDNLFVSSGYNFELGTITNVEQKILDVSNAITPFISYDSINDKLEVGKDMDLSINDLTCNFMRPLGGGKYGLSQNWTQSYLEFRNSGHHIDTFNANGTGRVLLLNYYAKSGVVIGGNDFNSTSSILGKLDIAENIGTAPTAVGGSLTLTHNDAGGTSSIVFKSKIDNNNDYGYISYRDNDGVSIQNSLLEIGVQNDGVGDNIDNIALMPSGYVGINTRTPQTMLDVNGDTNITGNLKLGSILDVEDAINNAGGVPSITYDEATETTTFDGSFVIIPADVTFQLGLIPNLYTYIIALNSRTSWLENTGQGLQINNNTIIEEDLGSRSSQLSIRPANDSQNAVQEIYSKNGTAQIKIGDDNGTTLTFNNILKSENGNATFYGNDGGSETKYMEYNSTDDKINILKDMDLSTNNFDCRFMRTYFGGAKYFLSQNYNSSYLEFRNGGHQLDAYNTNGTGRSLILNSFAESDVVLGSTINNSSTIINGNLNIIENTGTAPTTAGGSLTLTHNNIGGTSSIVFKSKKDPTSDYGYISYIDDISGDSGFERSLLEIGVKNDAPSDYVDNIALMPSAYVGINTRTPQSTLDVNGSVDCTEIKVNSIPINSFTNFKFGTNFANPGNWGRGNRIRQPISNPTLPSISHSLQFVLNSAQGTMTCEQLGTYEITSTVIYRNTNTTSSSGRRNPCIGIAINNDTNDDSGTNIAPKWDLIPHFTTPFACNYARFNEGKVCTLTAKRIHHFTNDTDIVSVNTYDQAATGDAFQDVTTTYLLLSASIQFKYIGNFDNIRGG